MFTLDKPAMSDPTVATAVESYCKTWASLGIRRNEPYALAWGNLSWEQRNEEVQKLADIDRRRLALLSKAAKYGNRKNYTPELSLEAVKLINDAEDLVPGSTCGANGQWSPVRMLDMRGSEIKWSKWIKNPNNIYKSIAALFPGMDLVTLTENIWRNLQTGVYLSALEYPEQQRERDIEKNDITPEEWDNTYKYTVAMARKLKVFMDECNWHKHSVMGSKIKGDEIFRLNTNSVFSYFSTDVQSKQWALLAFYVYFHHEVTIDPEYMDSCTVPALGLSNWLENLGGGVVAPFHKFYDFSDPSVRTYLKDEDRPENACCISLSRKGVPNQFRSTL